MRKKMLLALLIASQCSFAQKSKPYYKSTNDVSCPKFYLGLNTGLENPNGILGISFDIPVVDHFRDAPG